MLLLELAALAAALTLPVFTPREVSIDGADLLTESSLLASAAVPSASIFTIDPAAVRGRLQRVPLVRSVSVTTELPAGVRIAVTEWKPVLRLVVPGRSLYVAENGAAVDVAATRPEAAPSVPIVIDGRPDSPVGSRGEGLDPRLTQQLDATAAQFPRFFGSSVAAFQWQADGLFSIWSNRGWRAILGHVDTTDQVAALPGQLAALAALRGQLNLTVPQFGYVNLENPEAPAVGGTPGLPAEVTTAAASSLAPGALAPAAVSPVQQPAAADPGLQPAAVAPAPPPTPAAPVAVHPKPAAAEPAKTSSPAPPNGRGYTVYIPQGPAH
ncbi:MAG: cell division protein FtsQ/DivIB [Candidatus Dormibacteria bacterium]